MLNKCHVTHTRLRRKSVENLFRKRIARKCLVAMISGGIISLLSGSVDSKISPEVSVDFVAGRKMGELCL